MNDCKNCKYTDEYCASGDCNKIQANNLACNKISLTEQWKKGELPEGFYFVNDGAEITIDYYLCDYWERHFDIDIQQVLAPVPSYEEWKAKLEETAELKELLRECSYRIDWRTKTGHKPSDDRKQKLFDEISEALRCGNIK